MRPRPKRLPRQRTPKRQAHGDSGPNPLAVDPDLAIWTGVVFLLLFGILSVFAWPQIAAAVDERERKIADNIRGGRAKARGRQAAVGRARGQAGRDGR